MKWLLWREFRLNLLILVVAAFLLVAPYVIAVITVIVLSSIGSIPPTRGVPLWAAVLGGEACYSLFLNQLTFALLGGNAFAGERSDGSAEFMAYLPVTRMRRIVSKLLLTLIAALVIWGVNAAMMAFLLPYVSYREVEEALFIAMFVAITGLAFYCVGWLVSAIQSTPTFAVAAGLVVPFLLVATLQFIAWLVQWKDFSQHGVAIGYVVGCLLIVCICFPIGTRYYLRRVEP